MYRDCCYLWEGGHPGHNDIPDDFAEKVCAVISPDIQARMQPEGREGPPREKAQTGDGFAGLTGTRTRDGNR
jgi:hypothetical protein